jgi:nucleotide-binding universal stress UspA family protein
LSYDDGVPVVLAAQETAAGVSERIFTTGGRGMQNIVLATHGGVSSDGAARVAALLAARLHVALIPFVVYAPIRVVDYGYGATYIPSAEDEAAVQAALVEAVTEQLRRCEITSLSPTARTGIIPAEIAAMARAQGAGLIVTGLGSHSIVDRTLGGETALHLAQDAMVPVLAVPASATAIPRRVIAAIDFSATSVLAARTAASWLGAGDELHLVSVAPKPRHSEGAVPAVQPVVERLARVGEELGATGVRVGATELFGEPARTLLDHAQRIEADLIALGSHGYGAVKRLVLGSVASKIIRVASCAVLVAPIGCLET